MMCPRGLGVGTSSILPVTDGVKVLHIKDTRTTSEALSTRSFLKMTFLFAAIPVVTESVWHQCRDASDQERADMVKERKMKKKAGGERMTGSR